MRAVIARVRPIWFAPVLAVLALAAWAFASPVGASPDDDFHLVSTWCASANAGAICEETGDPATREVPIALLESACYGRNPATGAACQLDGSVDFDPAATVVTERGNYVGSYPPVFYAVMGLFAGPDVLTSVLIMRLVNAALAVGLITLIAALVPSGRRGEVLWPWLVGTIPLGIYLIPSNNPSSWAVLGVVTSWAALLGWFATTGRRRIGLAIAFFVALTLASGSRSDSAIYAGLGILVVLILRFEWSGRFIKQSIIGIVGGLWCLLLMASGTQAAIGVHGFANAAAAGGADGTAEPTLAGFALLAYNVLHLPSFLAGVFGGWGLGWLEVLMPPLVSYGALAAFLVFAGAGFAVLDRRKAISVALVGSALVAVPLYVLQQGGHTVGVEVQPRYVLPLVLLLAGVLALPASRANGRRCVRPSRGVRILLGVALVAAEALALHYTMRRYITGSDVKSFDLSSEVEWWWPGAPAPMLVYGVGVLAFAAMTWLVLRLLAEDAARPVVRR